MLPHGERLEEQGLFSQEKGSRLPGASRSLRRWSRLFAGVAMRTNGQKLKLEVQAGYKEKFYPHKDSHPHLTADPALGRRLNWMKG